MAEAVGLVRPGGKVYRQIPLDDGYWSRLEVRAIAKRMCLMVSTSF